METVLHVGQVQMLVHNIAGISNKHGLHEVYNYSYTDTYQEYTG